MNSLVNFSNILSNRGGYSRWRVARLRLCLAVIAMLGLVQSAEAAEPEAGTTAPASPSPAAAPSPVREYTDGDGRLCRVYERQVVIEGAPQTAYATVCREPDGRWVLSR
jgi:hypothetical protein